jgi:hypothetical protein
VRDQSPRPERRHCDDGGPIQPVWSSDLTPGPGWRPAPVASRHPSFERTCHVGTDPAGKVTWPRAPSRSRHFPTPSGPTAQTRSPPRRCPRRPESLQEVRSRLQPTVQVHTAAHDHGLVVVDPLDLFHRQHVRPRSPPRTDRPRWFGRSHQLTRARSRRRPAPAGPKARWRRCVHGSTTRHPHNFR